MSDTKELIDQIRARFEHSESKKYLHEKYSNQLTLAYRGGLWNITTQFISTLNALDATAIILDIYDVPIEVNTGELHRLALNKYNSVMRSWYDECQQLSTLR